MRRVADRDLPGRRPRADGQGCLEGSGVLGPEAFDALPFLELLNEYDGPDWGVKAL